ALYALSFCDKVSIPAYILLYARLHSRILLAAADTYLGSRVSAVFSRLSTQFLYRSTKLRMDASLVARSDGSRSYKYFMDNSSSLMRSFRGKEKLIDGTSVIGKKSLHMAPTPDALISQSTDVPKP